MMVDQMETVEREQEAIAEVNRMHQRGWLSVREDEATGACVLFWHRMKSEEPLPALNALAEATSLTNAVRIALTECNIALGASALKHL